MDILRCLIFRRKLLVFQARLHLMKTLKKGKNRSHSFCKCQNLGHCNDENWIENRFLTKYSILDTLMWSSRISVNLRIIQVIYNKNFSHIFLTVSEKWCFLFDLALRRFFLPNFDAGVEMLSGLWNLKIWYFVWKCFPLRFKMIY